MVFIESTVYAEFLLYAYWIVAPPNKTINKIIHKVNPLVSPDIP